MAGARPSGKPLGFFVRGARAKGRRHSSKKTDGHFLGGRQRKRMRVGGLGYLSKVIVIHTCNLWDLRSTLGARGYDVLLWPRRVLLKALLKT